jgi:hypothetical protein
MKTSFSGNTVALLTLPLLLLLMAATLTGIFDPGTYAAESMYYAIQGIGQDAVTLFIVVPLLALVTWFARKGGTRAYDLWSGLQFYIAYSYVLYAFSCHFNHMFQINCGILGLSVYSLLHFFYTVISSNMNPVAPGRILFRSTCLPALIITTVLLLRKQSYGVAFAPAMLVFCMVMAVAICGMVIAMVTKGLEADPLVSLIMIVLAIISFIFLLRYMKRCKTMTE